MCRIYYINDKTKTHINIPNIAANVIRFSQFIPFRLMILPAASHTTRITTEISTEVLLFPRKTSRKRQKMHRSNMFIAKRIPYSAMSHSSLHKLHMFFCEALTISSGDCKLLPIEHADTPAGNCLYMF